MTGKAVLILWLFLTLGAVAPTPGLSQTSTDFAAARRDMVTHQLQNRGLTDPRVLAALGRVPRHLFVLSKL
ncbi:MAG: protein-L-isoaspartate(D-aspartate) O-methyltransferase, partial [Deltaproteobacteria bacterium]|nr:protein-L-isoaspartate(D-aspartate) O-methyltransferase [Deltaproteobacteria bacterium]